MIYQYIVCILQNKYFDVIINKLKFKLWETQLVKQKIIEMP